MDCRFCSFGTNDRSLCWISQAVTRGHYSERNRLEHNEPMPALTRSFYAIEGELLAERDSNGRVDYAPDALGSVRARLTPSADVVPIYYRPYGTKSSGTE